MWLITPSSASRYLDLFRRYSRSKSKVVRNRTEVWMSLPSQILGMRSPKKLHPNYHAFLVARHVEKVREVTPIAPKVITANMLNFKQMFECSLLKIVGAPVPDGVCVSKPWPFSSMCANLRVQHPLRAGIVRSKF